MPSIVLFQTRVDRTDCSVQNGEPECTTLSHCSIIPTKLWHHRIPYHCLQLLAFVFNWGLLGILNTQVYVYYCNFPADRIYLRCLVYGILTFEWVQTGLVTAQMFDVYLYNYGNRAAIISTKWIWFSAPVMGSVIAATVQLFFAWRIFALAKPSKLHRAALRKAMYALVFVIAILSVGQAISGVTGGILARVSPSARDMNNADIPLTLWLVLSAVDDVLIATTMCILLLKSKTGFASTDALIHRIMKLTVETNAATAFFAVVLAIIAGIPPTQRSSINFRVSCFPKYTPIPSLRTSTVERP
ncbi:uncharacterized protein LAESUDRAFT_108835 [Laetiporus sulphureus 93-53]|uniref:DUF6534 domain-containing protein n=1 Tax=Laetiporus sulphureus 93-53 TaxID=1314785 RepID=A0A165EMR6_9APHY|nr:uncharacterized protein LAESUDRAFT_108835 [Laetiporus sulphureus 93-53]KZT07387.1 hypothetical protein LAESUDRAFT_108835 [Laetiporus sulphureus 93-53]